jgi:hypothetical protein
MLGQKVMIQKDRVVKALAQKFNCRLNRLGDVQVIALEMSFEPFVPASIVIQKKDTNRTTLCDNVMKAETRQHSTPDTHLL